MAQISFCVMQYCMHRPPRTRAVNAKTPGAGAKATHTRCLSLAYPETWREPRKPQEFRLTWLPAVPPHHASATNLMMKVPIVSHPTEHFATGN